MESQQLWDWETRRNLSETRLQRANKESQNKSPKTAKVYNQDAIFTGAGASLWLCMSVFMFGKQGTNLAGKPEHPPPPPHSAHRHRLRRPSPPPPSTLFCPPLFLPVCSFRAQALRPSHLSFLLSPSLSPVRPCQGCPPSGLCLSSDLCCCCSSC